MSESSKKRGQPTPVPKSISYDPGTYTGSSGVTIRSAEGLDDVADRALKRSIRDLGEVLGNPRLGTRGDDRSIVLAVNNVHSQTERYQLEITPDRTVLEGDGPRGLFYGVQTLRQIAMEEDNAWRCRVIEDEPDLAIRAVSLDVSRGRVPTVDTLKRMIDRLAFFKINQLQLYVEHTFDFAFDPDIGRDSSPLTADDIRAIDAHCRERFIDLVPSLACFGHMGRILSLPRYRHLAEIECEADWESQSWPQRARGLTLDARNPDSRRLIETMLDEYLPLFSSKFANIGGDETHDLGRGKNKNYCDLVGRGRLYVDHLKFLADICRRHGKRMMFWADVIRSFPELADELPEDAVFLDWGYEPDSTFPALTSPHRRGRDVIVCPGTSGWKRVINAFDFADANIAAASVAAKQGRATGMMITDWGDLGHFNQPACSMPAIAHAAALAWNANPIDRTQLDRAIERLILTFAPNARMDTLRQIARIGEKAMTWTILHEPFTGESDTTPITVADTEALAETADAARSMFADAEGPEANEWHLALRASLLLAEKLRLAAALTKHRRLPSDDARRFAEHVAAFARDFASHWSMNYRPYRLDDVTAALATLAEQATASPSSK